MFDGVFCRGSINIFWFDLEALEDFLEGLTSSLNDGAWLWIAPWNRPTEAQERRGVPGDHRRLVDRWAEANDVEIVHPDEMRRRELGINYGIPSVEVWRRSSA
jgi:hypothetical protein